MADILDNTKWCSLPMAMCHSLQYLPKSCTGPTVSAGKCEGGCVNNNDDEQE